MKSKTSLLTTARSEALHQYLLTRKGPQGIATLARQLRQPLGTRAQIEKAIERLGQEEKVVLYACDRGKIYVEGVTKKMKPNMAG